MDVVADRLQSARKAGGIVAPGADLGPVIAAGVPARVQPQVVELDARLGERIDEPQFVGLVAAQAGEEAAAAQGEDRRRKVPVQRKDSPDAVAGLSLR